MNSTSNLFTYVCFSSFERWDGKLTCNTGKLWILFKGHVKILYLTRVTRQHWLNQWRKLGAGLSVCLTNVRWGCSGNMFQTLIISTIPHYTFNKCSCSYWPWFICRLICQCWPINQCRFVMLKKMYHHFLIVKCFFSVSELTSLLW